MPNGMYFQAFLNSLRNRRAIEAHEFAAQQMIHKQVFDSINQSIQGLAQQVHDSKQKEAQFQYEATASGLFDPKEYQVKTETEQKMEDQLATIKAQTDSIRDEMISQMQYTEKPVGPGKSLGPEGQWNPENPADQFTMSQNLKLSLNKRLERLEQAYRSSSARADLMALNLQQYKESDQYNQEIKEGAWNKFKSTDYYNKYASSHDAYQNMLYVQRLQEKAMIEARAEAMYPKAQKSYTPAQQNVVNKIIDKANEVEKKNPFITNNQEQKSAFEQAKQSLYDRVDRVTSDREAINILTDIDRTLDQFKTYQEPPKKEKEKKTKEKKHGITDEDRKLMEAMMKDTLKGK